MRKRIEKIYGALVILFFLLFLYGLTNLRVNIQRSREQEGYAFVTGYSSVVVKDSTASVGERTYVQFRLPEIHEDYNSLVFFTKHQNVWVYVGGEQVYSLVGVDGFMLPNSPGSVLNQITFDKKDTDQSVRIELEPIYSAGEEIPDLLFGSRYMIVKDFVRSNLPTVLLCGLTILMGALLLSFIALERAGGHRRKSLVVLAFLSIVIGGWKMVDSNLVGLVTPVFPFVSVLPFLALMLLPFLAIEVIRSLVVEKTSVVWDIPYPVSFVISVIVIVLQAFGVADMRQNLGLIQLSLMCSALCVAIGLVQMWRKYGMTGDIKRAIWGGVCCAAWMAIDMLSYYMSSGMSTFPLSMLGYDVFAVIVLLDYLKASRKMMENGMHARHFEKLAFHDALTGFFNRAAYLDYLSKGDFQPEGCIAVNIDLNNLKKCNDQFGHDKGDIYIRESSIIIHDCFSEGGRCYRLGGDEFGVLLKGVSLEECQKRVERMHQKVAKFNEASKDIHMGIACGYALFDKAEDADIHGTVRRADKRMYEDKFRMKQLGL